MMLELLDWRLRLAWSLLLFPTLQWIWSVNLHIMDDVLRTSGKRCETHGHGCHLQCTWVLLPAKHDSCSKQPKIAAWVCIGCSNGMHTHIVQ